MATFQAADGLGDVAYVTATIPSGQSQSAAVDLQRYTLIGFIWPAAFTGTGLSFLASHDGNTFYPLAADSYGQNPATELAFGANTAWYQHVGAFAGGTGPRWLKLRAGTAGGPTNQAADRTFTLILKAL